MNEGSEIAYNVIPSVTEISGAKQIHISPSILVEQILPGNGVKYTATVSVGKRVKTAQLLSVWLSPILADKFTTGKNLR